MCRLILSAQKSRKKSHYTNGNGGCIDVYNTSWFIVFQAVISKILKLQNYTSKKLRIHRG